MKALRELSIRGKLVAIILGTTVLALGLAFAVVLASDVRAFRRDTLEGAQLVARVVADASVTELAFEDRVAAEQTLSRLASVSSIQRAVLFDAEGRPFVSYPAAAGGVAPRAAEPDMRRAPAAAEFREGVLVVTEPVEHRGERYGTLYLESSTELLERKIRGHVTTMLSVMALLILLSVLFALFLQRLISGPILALAAAARRVSQQHDYSMRVERVADDEVGALYDGFNDMLAQIERRQRERDEADLRTREKSQFLANMSHELRTPLNSIIGFSEVLAERLAARIEPREQRFLRNIQTSGEHLLGLINDILDLSKVEAGKMEMHFEAVTVSSIVDSVVNVMKGMAVKRAVIFAVQVPEGLPQLHADAVKLKQVLYNLASNAVKFSPEDGTVTIAARLVTAAESPLGTESVALEVTDRGPGIDPSDHEAVFEEFRQATSSSQRAVEGTGLGLALVRRLVEMHGGTVRLLSAPGAGSTFTVYLPLRFAEGRSPDPPPATVPRILVVEDDGAAYKRIAERLAEAGYTTAWARSGEEALGLARSHRPAAVLLDVILGGMDGWAVLRELKAAPETAGIPVVMVSVLQSKELGLALGADDYFLKPVDHAALILRLRELLGTTTARPRVLVIDGDPQVHALLEARLAPAGFDVEHARSGGEGLERAGLAPPAAVVLDLTLAGMDGLEVALRLKSDHRTAEIPVVVLAGRDLSDAERKRLRGTVARLIEKDRGGEDELFHALRAVLDHHPPGGDTVRS